MDEIIFNYEVYLMIQYFIIYFNKVIQNTIEIFKEVGQALLVLSLGRSEGNFRINRIFQSQPGRLCIQNKAKPYFIYSSHIIKAFK